MHRAGKPSPTRAREHGSARLAADLERWVGAGLLSEAAAGAIRVYEQQQAAAEQPPSTVATARPRRIPPVAEALGYLGGVLAVTGLVLVLARLWQDVPTAGRLVLSAGGAAGLLVAGAVVHAAADPAFARLRATLWTGATAAIALAAAILARDVFDTEHGLSVAIACSAAVTVASGALWRGGDRPVQQATCLAGLTVFAGTLVANVLSTGAAGVAVGVVGAVLVVTGLRRSTLRPVLAELVGAAAIVVGAVIVSSGRDGGGLLLAVAAGVALLAVAVVPDIAPGRADRIGTAIAGGIVLLQGIPPTLAHFADHAGFVTGLTTWLLGAAIVAAGWRGLVRAPAIVQIGGAAAMLGGAALTGVQVHGGAPLLGIATAVGLVALGTIPGHLLMSLLGTLGLLINVPWAIGWFFPGEGRVPLLILVAGALIIVAAVLLTRVGGRLRGELRGTPPAR